MIIQSLHGSWQFRQVGKDEWLPAQVPGSTYADLLALDKIPDPFVGKNEEDVQWVSKTDWEYTQTFEVSKNLLKEDQVDLVCDHLDTIAEISINGKVVAQSDNMFRTYRWNVKAFLQDGENTISVVLRSPVNYKDAKQAENKLPAMMYDGIAHIRKVQSHFGWDWGPVLPVSGISGTLQLQGWSKARLNDVQIRQRHDENGVNLSIRAEIESLETDNYTLEINLTDPHGKSMQKRVEISGNKVETDLLVSDPQLWWSNGLGEQPLYTVEIRLMDGRKELDTNSKKIGLRTIKLRREKDQWGESFTFVVNGVPIFAKGANWIPADSINTRFGKDRLEHLIASTAAANMNMLRVWGGGYFESETFYDLCDQYGILVWQDFTFACAAYPLDVDAFVDNVKLEAVDNIRRLRHRACLALWCGNNEIDMMWMMWKKHKSLTQAYENYFYNILPEIVKAEDPDTDYWFSSPTSGTFMKNTNKDNWGDTHLWQVWHGMQPFTWYRKRFTRFCSEFGFESLPDMKTIETFAEPKDYDIVSDVMLHHQRCVQGNEKMLYYMTDRFRIPRDFADMVSMTQIVQAEAMRYGTEHWRRNRDRCSGALYWQLNDCWPVASWASIDHYGRWKALHYFAKRFNAPVALSLAEQDNFVNLFVTNDLKEDWKGEIRWSLQDFKGGIFISDTESVLVGSTEAYHVKALNFENELKSFGKKNVVFVAELWQEDQFISRQTVLFEKEKDIELPQPGLKAVVCADGDDLNIAITAEKFARYVMLTLPQADVIFSDNYFDLPAGATVNITAKCPQGMSVEEVQSGLVVRSLADMEPAGTPFSDYMTHLKIKFNPNILKFQILINMMD